MKENVDIIAINFHDPDLELVKEFCNESNIDVKLDSIDDVSELNILDEVKIIFLFHDRDDKKLDKDLKFLNEKVPHFPVVVIIGKKNYKNLMTAYRWNSSDILDIPFEKRHLRKAYTKSMIVIEIGSDQKLPLPYTELIHLFSTPTNIKSDNQYFEYLKNYFSLFQSVKNFCVFAKEKNEVSSLYEQKKICQKSTDKIVSELSKFKEFGKFIGKYSLIEADNGKHLYVIPAYADSSKIFFCIISIDKDKSDKVINEYFLKFLKNVYIYRSNKHKVSELKHLANTDEITGLFNQRKLTEDLAAEIVKHEKSEDCFSLMFIDVDHFKRVNDNYGHVIGSQMLTQIGEVLKNLLRQSDYVYRYGGDEFVCIMPKASAENVHMVATRILNAVKAIEFDVGNDEIYKLSISIGIAEYPTDAVTATNLLSFADEMMYRSKDAGRGKVFHVREVRNAADNSK